MSHSTTIAYDVPANFTYDTSLLEIVASVARLKSQIPTGATFGATFTSSINASWSTGTGTGTATGGAAVAGGKLDCKGGTVKYVSYDDSASFPSTQVGCFKFKYTPNYGGAPVNNRALFDNFTALGTPNNSISIVHQLTGNLRIEIYNSSGSSIFSGNLASFNPVSGTEYEFELNFDFTSGATRLFINGVQQGSTIIATGTRSAAAKFRIGSDRNAVASDGEYNDLIIFSTVQHTANYTPGYSLSETEYSTAKPPIIVNSGTELDDLDSFAESATKPAGTEIKYQLVFSGTPYWFNGAAWAVATLIDYTQANTASEIEANKAALSPTLAGGGTLHVRAFLDTTGNVRPLLSTVTYGYDFYVSVPADPPKCTVYGFLKDLLGDPITQGINDAKMIFEIKKAFEHTNQLIGPAKHEIPFDDEGRFEVDLIETQTVAKNYDISMTFTQGGKARIQKFAAAQVPLLSSRNITDITNPL
jgi:hypothetical protein